MQHMKAVDNLLKDRNATDAALVFASEAGGDTTDFPDEEQRQIYTFFWENKISTIFFFPNFFFSS